MKCNDIQKELVPFFLNESTPETNKELEEHIASCPVCARMAVEVSRFVSVVPRAKRADASINIWPLVREQLWQRRFWGAGVRWGLVPALNLVVFGILIGQFYVKQPSRANAVDQEIVQNMEFLTEYDMWDNMDFFEDIDVSPVKEQDR